MKNKKRIASLLLSLLMLVSCMTAAAITTEAATSGNERGTQVINVQTANPWWFTQQPCIELKQNKCTYSYQNFSVWRWRWETKTGSIYPSWRVTVKNLDNGKTKKFTWTSNWTQIKLDKDARYQITVSPDSTSTWLRSGAKSGEWKNSPYWWVNKQWHLKSVY